MIDPKTITGNVTYSEPPIRVGHLYRYLGKPIFITKIYDEDAGKGIGFYEVVEYYYLDAPERLICTASMIIAHRLRSINEVQDR